MGNKKGFGFYLGRFLIVMVGLIIGAIVFLYQTLGNVDFVNIQGVDQDNTNDNNLAEYFRIAESQDEGNLGHVELFIDPDYPITYVEQKDSNVENILVFGIDSRGEEAARADSIMIVTVNRNDNSIKLTSVLRDTEMNMNSSAGSRNKVNASYAFGGVGMLINTLNSNLDLDIQRFVMFDFWSAVGFVDALGGVTLNISSQAELDATNDVINGTSNVLGENPSDYHLQSTGEIEMNGIQAISWARVRAIDSDFGRTSRQRMLADSMIEEFSNKNLISQGNFAVSVLNQLETNIDRNNMVRIGFNAVGLLGNRDQYYVPQEGMYDVNYNNWNMIYDPAVQIPDLHNFIWNTGE